MTGYGYQARSAREIRDWRGDVYAVSRVDHHSFKDVPERLAANDLVVFLSQGSLRQQPGPLAWCLGLIGREDVKGPSDWLQHIGFKLVAKPLITGHILIPMGFVDGGAPLSHWRIADPRYGGPSFRLLDTCNPFSQILLEWCDRDLSAASTAIMESTFVSGAVGPELEKLQNETVEFLKTQGVIPASVSFTPVIEADYEPHECPYGERDDEF